MSRRRKRYDRDYFERWYRDPRHAVIHRDLLERRVRFAVSACEFLLERSVRSVLDVGCGEAPWRGILKRLRPRVRYQGVDSSEYVVRRYGRERNILRGGLGELHRLRLRAPFDLVVCSDVLHYVSTAEVGRGLRTIARLLGGMAFLETYTGDDPMEGDDEEFRRRGAARYRRLFREAGLIPLGLHCYAGRRLAPDLMDLERAAGSAGGR